MTALAPYAENAVLEHLFKNTALSVANAYIGYFNNSITDDSVPTEVSGNGYARIQIDNKMGTATNGSISNTTAISFNAASGGDHGTIVAIAIFDALSGGNMIAFGNLSSPRTISDGDQLSIAVGNLTISLD